MEENNKEKEVEQKIIQLLKGMTVLDARYLLDRVKIGIEKAGVIT